MRDINFAALIGNISSRIYNRFGRERCGFISSFFWWCVYYISFSGCFCMNQGKRKKETNQINCMDIHFLKLSSVVAF